MFCIKNQDNQSLTGQKNLARTLELLRSEQEVPILSPSWINVFESGYINTFDDALDVLENARQLNIKDIPYDHFRQ